MKDRFVVGDYTVQLVQSTGQFIETPKTSSVCQPLSLPADVEREYRALMAQWETLPQREDRERIALERAESPLPAPKAGSALAQLHEQRAQAHKIEASLQEQGNQRYQTQLRHLQQWQQTCADQEGLHREAQQLIRDWADRSNPQRDSLRNRQAKWEQSWKKNRESWGVRLRSLQAALSPKSELAARQGAEKEQLLRLWSQMETTDQTVRKEVSASPQNWQDGVRALQTTRSRIGQTAWIAWYEAQPPLPADRMQSLYNQMELVTGQLEQWERWSLEWIDLQRQTIRQGSVSGRNADDAHRQMLSQARENFTRLGEKMQSLQAAARQQLEQQLQMKAFYLARQQSLLNQEQNQELALRRLERTPEAQIPSLQAAAELLRKRPEMGELLCKQALAGRWTGNVDAWCEFIQCYWAGKDYDSAYKLCRAALQCYPMEPTLSRMSLELLMEIDPNQAGTESDALMQSLETGRWSEKTFRAMLRFCDRQMHSKLFSGDFEAYYQQGLQIARQMQKDYKWQEDGYYYEARLCLAAADKADTKVREQVEDLLHTWTLEPLDPDWDTSTFLQCPRCCELYLKEFLMPSGDWYQVQQVAQRGCEILQSQQGNKDDSLQSYFAAALRRATKFVEQDAD